MAKRNGAKVQRDTPEIFGDVTRREGQNDEGTSEDWRQTKTTEDARGGERQQKLALPPRDACRPIKKRPARIPNCLSGRSCFSSVCCDAVNPTTLGQPANWRIRSNSGAATELCLFYFSAHLNFPVLPPKSRERLWEMGNDSGKWKRNFIPAVGDLATS